jgi:hypothetical protein
MSIDPANGVVEIIGHECISLPIDRHGRYRAKCGLGGWPPVTGRLTWLGKGLGTRACNQATAMLAGEVSLARDAGPPSPE